MDIEQQEKMIKACLQSNKLTDCELYFVRNLKDQFLEGKLNGRQIHYLEMIWNDLLER